MTTTFGVSPNQSINQLVCCYCLSMSLLLPCLLLDPEGQSIPFIYSFTSVIQVATTSALAFLTVRTFSNYILTTFRSSHTFSFSYPSFQLINWSLAVPLSLWAVTGVLLIRSLHLRSLISAFNRPNKTPKQKLLFLGSTVLFMAWIVLTVTFIAPFSGRLQVKHLCLSYEAKNIYL